MTFWRRISPRGAIEDLVHEWRRPNPYRWRILGVSVAATFALMVVMIPESERVEPQPPEVTWITTFKPDRTDAEIVASNIENQKRKEAREAQAEARAEERRQRARALGEAMGFDVDELERQYSDDPEPAAAAPSEPARTESE
jgi:hypothetical protein